MPIYAYMPYVYVMIDVWGYVAGKKFNIQAGDNGSMQVSDLISVPVSSKVCRVLSAFLSRIVSVCAYMQRWMRARAHTSQNIAMQCPLATRCEDCVGSVCAFLML